MLIILVVSNKGQKYCTMTHVGYYGGVIDSISYHEPPSPSPSFFDRSVGMRWSACVTQTPLPPSLPPSQHVPPISLCYG